MHRPFQQPVLCIAERSQTESDRALLAHCSGKRKRAGTITTNGSEPLIAREWRRGSGSDGPLCVFDPHALTVNILNHNETQKASHYHSTCKITSFLSLVVPAACSICIPTRDLLEDSSYAVSGPGRPAVSTRVQIYLASCYRSATQLSWYIHEVCYVPMGWVESEYRDFCLASANMRFEIARDLLVHMFRAPEVLGPCMVSCHTETVLVEGFPIWAPWPEYSQ